MDASHAPQTSFYDDFSCSSFCVRAESRDESFSHRSILASSLLVNTTLYVQEITFRFTVIVMSVAMLSMLALRDRLHTSYAALLREGHLDENRFQNL